MEHTPLVDPEDYMRRVVQRAAPQPKIEPRKPVETDTSSMGPEEQVDYYRRMVQMQNGKGGSPAYGKGGKSKSSFPYDVDLFNPQILSMLGAAPSSPLQHQLNSIISAHGLPFGFPPSSSPSYSASMGPPGHFDHRAAAEAAWRTPWPASHEPSWQPPGLAPPDLSRPAELGEDHRQHFGAAVEGPLPLSADQLLGMWADSLGNAVSVAQTDAYQLKLTATLSQPPRKDIHLAVRPTADGGWNCGNALLDPVWSTSDQLHWHASDGRVSVWVRLPTEDTEAALLQDAMQAATEAKAP